MKENVMTIMEPSSDRYGSYFVIDQILYDQRSEYQRVTVFESEGMGRVLMLDNIFNVSTEMEAYYHEPMAHIPLAMVRGARDVLLVGGGDFGIAREILKHEHIERLVMCELDGKVIEACRTYFPEWAEACEKDERFELIVGDGCKYIKDCSSECFDAVIIDSTDPFKAPMLISEEFYIDVKNVMRDGAVMMQIVADFMLYRDAWKTIFPRINERFESARPLFLSVPFYATGDWGLVVAGKGRANIDPANCSQAFFSKIPGLQVLQAERVQGWFALTPAMQRFFAELGLR